MTEWGRVPRRNVPKVPWRLYDYGFLLIGSLLVLVSLWAVAEIIWG